MNILITNQQLWPMRGSENWCYSVGQELVRRGHQVFIYSPMPREGAKAFADIGIKFTACGDFDLILENHNVLPPTCKGRVIIHTCHGSIREERPMPGVINVAATDRASKAWNLDTVIYNGIDCERMKPIKEPNKEIRNVLSLCSSREADNVIREICGELGYSFWPTYGQEVLSVENLINWADVVFGVGRSCLDAMACGRLVISFDCRPYIHMNHGLGYLYPYMVKNDQTNLTGPQNTWTKEELKKELLKYDTADGIHNRDYILNFRNIQETVNRYLLIYEETKDLQRS